MKIAVTTLALLVALASGFAACTQTPLAQQGNRDTGSVARPATTSATLQAGAAQSLLDLPVGVPLAAFTGRLDLFDPEPDERDSDYTTEFAPSALSCLNQYER